MAEKVELTRGQKIDAGDEVRANIVSDRSVVDTYHREMADKFRTLFASRAEQLVELGCFPEETSGKVQDVEDIPEESWKLVGTTSVDRLLCVELGDDDYLFLNILGELVEATYKRVPEIGSILDSGSWRSAEPAAYSIHAKSVLDSMEKVVKEAQRAWIGSDLLEEDY